MGVFVVSSFLVLVFVASGGNFLDKRLTSLKVDEVQCVRSSCVGKGLGKA